LRCEYIQRAKKAYPVKILCQVLNVHRSYYYRWCRRNESRRDEENRRLEIVVREIHKISRGTYGNRRISKELKARGFDCGRSRTRTIMRLAGIRGRQKRRIKITTDSGHNFPIAPNLLKQNFKVDKPNTAWVSDITYIWTSAGWLYLAIVVDLYSRRVVGWATDKRMKKELVIKAFEMAVFKRIPEKGLIFHSDRGSQYCSIKFRKLIKAHGFLSSMSKKGDCYDNAVAESFFSTLKKECVYLTSYRTRKEASNDVIKYIEMFYNPKRRHSFLGYVSPMEYENHQLLRKSA